MEIKIKLDGASYKGEVEKCEECDKCNPTPVQTPAPEVTPDVEQPAANPVADEVVAPEVPAEPTA